MAYTTNPHLPRVRMEAIRLVRQGWSTRQAARHLGYSQSAIVKWLGRAGDLPGNARIIPTRSSRPHSHPQQLSDEMVSAIIRYRQQYQRCAEVIHHLMARDGYELSLSSIKRVLKRYGYTRYSRWKKWHQYPPRPVPTKPGVLLQVDTIHRGPSYDRLYVYALIDVCSRWGDAWPTERITTHQSLGYIERTLPGLPFTVETIQTDHGAEFSKWLTKRLDERGVSHRHARVRKPTDNGHVERFIRTLQEECLDRVPRTLRAYQKALPEYLEWYNTGRPHMALDMKTPAQVIPSY